MPRLRPQLDDRNDAIGFGEFAVMDQTTSNAEREHVRDRQTDGGAPHQAHDVPGMAVTLAKAVRAAIRSSPPYVDDQDVCDRFRPQT